MNIKEFREMTPTELEEKLSSLRQRRFELNRLRAVGSLENPDEIRLVRKDIAKAETVKRERELANK